MHNMNKGFPVNSKEATKDMLLKDEDKFMNQFVTLHRKLSNSNNTTYAPILQQANAIMS